MAGPTTLMIERYKAQRALFELGQARNRASWAVRLRRAHARGECIRGCFYPDHPAMDNFRRKYGRC